MCNSTTPLYSVFHKNQMCHFRFLATKNRGETIYRLTVYRGTQASVRFTVRGGLETV